MMIYPVGFGKTQDGFIPFKIAETKILWWCANGRTRIV